MYRIYSLKVNWAIAPGNVKLQYSPNATSPWWNAFNGVNFKSTVQGGDLNFWESVVRSDEQRAKYKSFISTFTFEAPTQADRMKIVMKIPVNNYFAIYKIDVYTKEKEDIMISDLTGLLCWTNNGGNEGWVFMERCAKNIAWGDNRELFTLDNKSNQLLSKENIELSWIDDWSLNSSLIMKSTSSSKKGNQTKGVMSTWLIGTDNKIRSLQEMNKCLSYNNDNIFPYDIVKVLSTSTERSDNLPINVWYPNTNNHWLSASVPETEKVTFKWEFDYNVSITKIKLVWKLPCNHYRILAKYHSETKEIFRVDSPNHQDTVVIDMEFHNVEGIKSIEIEMEGRTKYGIDKIELFNDSYYISNMYCDLQSVKNRFKVIYLNDSDLGNYRINSNTSNDFKSALNKYHELKSKFEQIDNIKEAKTMNIPREITALKGIQTEIFNITNTINIDNIRIKTELKQFNITTKTVKRQRVYGSCNSVDKKENGYYYIETPCMRTPRKVYCDYDSKLNFYNLKVDSINSIQTLQNKCAEIGWEPVSISSVDDWTSWLTFIRRNQLHNVPIAYKYNSKSTKFVNWSSEHSNTMNNLFPSKVIDYNKNTIFYASEELRFQSADLKEIKVENIICSSTMDNLKYLKWHCNSTWTDYPYLDINTNLKVSCPINCGDVQGNVYGKNNKYHEQSSICKSGIHSGAITNDEGGLFELSVIQGHPRHIYSKNRNNGIIAKEYQTTLLKHRAMKMGRFNTNCYKKGDISLIEISNDTKIIDHIHFNQIKNIWDDINSNILNAEMLSTSYTELNRLECTNIDINQKAQANQCANIFYDNYFDLTNSLVNHNDAIHRIEVQISRDIKESNDEMSSIAKSIDTFEEKFISRNWNDRYHWTFNEHWYIDDKQTLRHKNKSPVSSHLFIKNVVISDFEWDIAFTLITGDVFGVTFHTIDQFNYYSIEFSNKIISMNKVISNEITVWDSKINNDGIITPNTAYSVKIKYERYDISLYILNNLLPGKEYVEILHCKDRDIGGGEVSWYSKHYSDIKITRLSIHSWHTQKRKGDSDGNGTTIPSSFALIPTQCVNHYYTSYTNFKSFDINSNWLVIREESHSRRENVLYQNVKSRYNTTNEEGSWYIDISTSMQCKENGILSFKFNPLDRSGIIGIVFNFQDPQSYYICEIGADFVRLRNKHEGTWNIVAINNKYGYTPNTWYKIVIKIDVNGKVSVYFGEITRNIKNVFKNELFYINGNYYNSHFGFSTFDTPAYFDEWDVKPGKLSQKSSNSEIKENRCLWYNTVLLRNDYCSIYHKDSQEQCKDTFCASCCNDTLKEKTKNNLWKCKDECDHLELLDKDKDFKTCYNSEEWYDNECSGNSSSTCKLDLCYLCCSSSTNYWMNQGEKSDCFKGCKREFGVQGK